MSEPTTAGIPPEIKKRLESTKKSLPPINTGAGQPAPESDVMPLSGAALESLVNENEDQLAPGINLAPNTDLPEDADPKSLEVQIEKYKAIISQQNGDIKVLKTKLTAAQEEAKGGKLEDSRKFRVFLSLLEGLAAKGEFAPESLMQGGGGIPSANKRLADRMQHAAGLVSHAMAAINNLPEKFRF